MTDADYDYILGEIERCEKMSLDGMRVLDDSISKKDRHYTVN